MLNLNGPLKIIIPTCGAISEEHGFFFERFLDSLCSHPVNHPWQAVIVVNNEDAERRADVARVVNKWQEDGMRLWLISVTEKIGYVGACNMGYSVLSVRYDDYVAVLNDDTVIEGDWFSPLKDSLDSVKEPTEGEYFVGQAGPSIHWVGRDGCWGKGNEKYQFIEGWCFVTRGLRVGVTISEHHIKGHGLFDEIYAPTYCEDVDLSIAMQECGFKVVGVDNVPIRHLHSQTITEREPYWTDNRKRLAEKWTLADD